MRVVRDNITVHLVLGKYSIKTFILCYDVSPFVCQLRNLLAANCALFMERVNSFYDYLFSDKLYILHISKQF